MFVFVTGFFAYVFNFKFLVGDKNLNETVNDFNGFRNADLFYHNKLFISFDDFKKE